MRAALKWTERLRRKLIHLLGGVGTDEVCLRPVAAAESYATEKLTCSYWKTGNAGYDEQARKTNLALMADAADKAGLVEWTEVSWEEEPEIWLMMGMPDVKDKPLMRGTMRMLRKAGGVSA